MKNGNTLPKVCPDIIDAALKAFTEGDGIAFAPDFASPSPVQILVEGEGDSYDFRMFAWPMVRDSTTSGRRFRMEVGTVNPSDFGLLLGGPLTPLILGYVREFGVFVGFNYNLGFDRTILSATVDTAVLHLAIQHGIAFGQREDGIGRPEAIVAIRPDLLLYYAVNSPAIHRTARKPVFFEILTDPKFYSNPFEEVKNLPEEDQYVVKDIAEKIRNRKFTISVYNAYNRRCAVSRIQLGLAQAAHIFPFRFLGATDDVTNGIALSPNFHKSFDSGLIYLDTAYVMRINVGKYNELDRQGMGGGFEYLKEYIQDEPAQILLPIDERQQPDKKMILKGLMARGIVPAPRKPPSKPSLLT